MTFITNVKYYSRCLTFAVLLAICATYGVIISCVFSVIGKKRLSQWSTARCFDLIISKCLGIKIKIFNKHILDKSSPCIFVSNHQSTLDILMLGAAFPQGCTITAKKSLKYVPFLGWFMSLSGTLYLDRSNSTKSIETLNKGLQKIVKEKNSFWIYPEGTRSKTTELKMNTFKKGAFWLAKQGGIPIVPLVVSNSSTINCEKLKIFNRGTIYIKVLEPQSLEKVETKEDMNEFVAKLQKLMNDELKNNVGYSIPIDSTGVPKEYQEWLKEKKNKNVNFSNDKVEYI